MRSLVALLLGSIVAWALASGPAGAQQAAAPPDASDEPATPDKIPLVHLPKDFWGMELRSRPPFTGHPDVFGLWKLADGSLAVGIFWKNEGQAAPAAATILNLSTGGPALPDEEAWKAANDDNEMARMEQSHGMTWFRPSPGGILLPPNGEPVKMIEDKAKGCAAPLFDSLVAGPARVAIFKPFAAPYRFDLKGCGDGLSGNAAALWKTIYLILVPVDDGTFLGLEINFPEADDTPATLIVRFRRNLTSPFFEQKSDYVRVDYARIARYVDAEFRSNPQQAILDLQQLVTGLAPKAK